MIIGFSICPENRIKQLKTEWVNAQALQLIATIAVPDGQSEKMLHKRFEAYNIDYEWFIPVLALYNLIHEVDTWKIYNDLIVETLL